jgi:L-alanine-DL-glutamate epimerase-like enolase superfamily enzyme
MKIREIRTAGLLGNTPKGGWQEEIIPEDCIHTLIAVHTDEGVVGLGSVYTSDALVNAALKVLRPLCIGENALDPNELAKNFTKTLSGKGVVAPSPTRLAVLILPCGTFSAKSRGNPSQGYWEAFIEIKFAPTLLS